MPARNQIDQAVKIRRGVDPQFATDILVRTPYNLAWRLKEGDSFLQEIVSKGKVLYGSRDHRSSMPVRHDHRCAKVVPPH